MTERMPITPQQVQLLYAAINGYAFPPAYFDYSAGAPIVGPTMRQVEGLIKSDLLAGSPFRIKDGLSNILYWGFAQMGGLALVRVNRFRTAVNQAQLQAACQLIAATPRPTLFEIKALGLPQFSAVSFVSKVRMFLDPDRSATLDQQIMKIHNVSQSTVLASVRRSKTSIPVTKANSLAYESWCDRLEFIRNTYLPTLRVVDIERGLFYFVQSGQVAVAAQLLANA